MDPFRNNLQPQGTGAPFLAPVLGPQGPGQPSEDSGTVFGPPVGDNVNLSRPERERDQGSIPNFAAAFGQPEADPNAPKNAQGQPETQTERAGRERDEAMMAHVCGGGCGCISTGPGRGQDVTKVFEERDQEVRTHEQEHLSAAGEHARGGPTFETYTASNGKSYVTGGKVEVDMGEAGDPKKTADKMQKIRKAALAPRTPSSQDRAVEAEAAGKEAEALGQVKANEQKQQSAGLVPGIAA